MNSDMIPIPRLDRTDANGAQVQWPRIVEDPRVLSDWWKGRPAQQPAPPRLRQKRAAARSLTRRFVSASVKGVLLGIVVAGIVMGILPTLPWWMLSWHWAIAGLAALLIAATLGFRSGLATILGLFLLVVGIVGWVQAAPSLAVSWPALVASRSLPAEWAFALKLVAFTVVLRAAWEGLRAALWTG